MRKRHELLDEKEAVLKSLKDLEFEREVGKLSDEDFRRLESEFRTRAKAHPAGSSTTTCASTASKAEQLLVQGARTPLRAARRAEQSA